jgi:hypothetical protein
MTPEQKADFVKLFSGPRKWGRDRFCGRLFDLVRLPDGTVGFVRNALDLEIEEAVTNAMDNIFGPEPAEDD